MGNVLLVKTKIGPSAIEGIGLFADQFIPKGTSVWKFVPRFDMRFSKADVAAMPEILRETFLKYAYLNADKGKYVWCFDNARFFNHSDDPNCIQGPPIEGKTCDIAVRDISLGEEITGDYRAFDAAFEKKMRM